MSTPDFKRGYLQALADINERLDNAVSNWEDPRGLACWHWDF